MFKRLLLAIFLLTSAVHALAENPHVLLKTNKGDIELELFAEQAPISVKNFLRYVNEGFYDGTIFHRVIKRFMVQGGGFTEQMKRKETHEPIKNEADNRIRNRFGTIAMARTSDPHSATAQFFINTINNNSLDFREKTNRAWGYAVFGRVIKGVQVVKAIEMVPTGVKNRMRDVPLETVKIIKASVIK